MTTYFVDPVNGSNSNNGLSWGAAWRWPPGNGAAVNPGDEIRFAKSAEKTPTGSQTIQADNVNLTTGMGYSLATLGFSWALGSGGGSIIGNSLTLPNSHNVPANTKLMYVALSRTQTSGFGLEHALKLLNIPSSAPGGNIRVRICSDAAGNTPILNLEGPTWLSPSFEAEASYLYNTSSTLNFTMGSIAVYSVSAFTTPASGTVRISAHTRLHVTPDQSLSTSWFFRRGTALRLLNPPTPACGFSGTRYDFYGACKDYDTSGTGMIPDPSWRRGPRDNGQISSTGMTMYAALPYQSTAVYEAPLSYNGSSGNRIRMSGGWDTASGLQDGFTNIAIDLLWWCPRKAAFVFSSGAGNWIDYERFIALQTHLVYFDYTVTAISGVRLFDCTVGVPFGPTVYEASVFSAPGITAPVAVDNWYAERCTLADWFSFQGPSARYTHTSFTFGGVDLVDCIIHGSGTKMQTVVCPSGNISLRSSVAGEIRCLLVSVMSNNTQLRPAAGAAGVVTYDGVAVCAHSHDASNGAAGAASDAAGVFRNVFTTDFGYTGSTQYDYTMKVGNYKTLTIDGYGFHNTRQTSAGNRPTNEIEVNNAAAFHTNNPGATLAIGGPVYSATLTGFPLRYRSDAVRLTNPPAVIDFAAGPRVISQSPNAGFRTWPGLIVGGWSGLVTISNFIGSYIHFDLPAYTAGTYWPNVPQAVVEDSDGKVSSSGPLGVVRKYGGLAYSLGDYALCNMTMNPIGHGTATYGAEVDSLYDQNVSFITPDAFEKRAIGVGITGTLIKYGYSAGTYFYNRPLSVNLEESATLDHTPSANGSYYRGMMLRKPSGYFFTRKASKNAESSQTLNEYGKRTITLSPNTGFNIARLEVLAGTLINVVIKVRCLSAITLLGYFRCSVVIPPCTAYTTDLAGHYIRKNLTTSTDDTPIGFSLAPQKDGEIYINLFTTTNLAIKDFSATVA